MPDKIEIGAEEAAAMWGQFDRDSNLYMKEHGWLADHEEDADKHALALAVARERERSLAPVIEHLKRCEALTHQMGERYDQRYQIAIETLEAVAKKIRGEE